MAVPDFDAVGEVVAIASVAAVTKAEATNIVRNVFMMPHSPWSMMPKSTKRFSDDIML
jgi:hypothetical protein